MPGSGDRTHGQLCVRPRLADRRHAALRCLVFVASKPLGHLRDLLLLLFDESAKALDRPPRVFCRDAAAVAVVAAPAAGDKVRWLQNRCGACELGTRWWTVVA
jgi:hypothetical protein